MVRRACVFVLCSPDKILKLKYDPIVRQHVLFVESKLPSGKKR